MGKRQNNQPQAQGQAQEQGKPAENPPEQKKDEGSATKSNDEKKEENKANPKGVIVLGVYMHCDACARDVVKSLGGFEGVEGIETDMKNHKVTVKGKKADPLKVAERVRKKCGKHVDLISPIPSKDKEEKKPAKKEEPKAIEVVLKIFMHCESCVKEIKQCIHKMPGVQMVEPDMQKSVVKVKGTMDAAKLVEFVNKRAGKHAEIVKSDKKDGSSKGKQDENKSEEKKDGKKECPSSSAYDKYHPDLVYAPQLFSDENPNACSVM